MFHFVGQVIGGSINLEEDEIKDSAWVKVSELVKADDDKLRDPSAIKQIANCLVKKITIPLVYSINKLNKSPCSANGGIN